MSRRSRPRRPLPSQAANRQPFAPPQPDNDNPPAPDALPDIDMAAVKALGVEVMGLLRANPRNVATNSIMGVTASVIGEVTGATTSRAAYEAAATAFTAYAQSLPIENLLDLRAELGGLALAGPRARLKGSGGFRFRPDVGDAAATIRKTNALRLKLQRVMSQELSGGVEFTVALGAPAFNFVETVSTLYGLGDRAAAFKKAAEILLAFAEDGPVLH